MSAQVSDRDDLSLVLYSFLSLSRLVVPHGTHTHTQHTGCSISLFSLTYLFSFISSFYYLHHWCVPVYPIHLFAHPPVRVSVCPPALVRANYFSIN